jgi:hypothetical protein
MFAAWLVLSAAPLTHSAPLGLMIPAYFYPSAGGPWNELAAAAARVPLVAIMNPDSGPGQSRDITYVQALSKLHQAGGKVTAYVHTSYGARPLAEVEKDINLYRSFYQVDGFFIDEMTDDESPEHLDYYAAIYQYIKGKDVHYTVTGNPGTNTRETYLTRPTDDSLMIFEDNGTNYTRFAPAQWVTRHSAQQFVHLPYGVPTAATMTNDVELAVSRNAGWICITDDTLPNPYNTLPSYWKSEVDLVEACNHIEIHPDLSAVTHTADKTKTETPP